MRKRSLLVAAVAAAAVLPLAHQADQATCSNCTTSLASTVNGPVTGDEAFFKLPTGPSNVMFLLDTSGSMTNIPQCGDNSWDSGGLPTCTSPNLPLTAPDGVTSWTTVTGTCTPDTSGFTTTSSNLKWMEGVTPQNGYADPGRTNALLSDCPPWGNGGAACGTRVCSGSGCLFDPTAYYLYNDWTSSGGGSGGWSPTTTRRALDGVTVPTTAEPTAACIAFDTSGNVIKDFKTGAPVSLGPACTTCMATHGFYLYKVSYFTSSSSVKTVTRPLFKGTFLNANPPKFVTARQVLKNIAWMDPAAPSSLDQVRLGLTVLDASGSSPRKGKLIVPLGPDKGGAYPPTQQGFRQARQYLLSVLNYDTTRYTDASGKVICDGSTSGSSGFQNGFFNPATNSTPLGSVLFNIGQYFTAVSPSLYANTFGATGCGGGSCVTSEFNETSAGRVNAAWVTTPGNTQCSICWGCQNSSVVVVTDGSPNNEIGFPSTIATWDTTAYSSTTNCAGTYAAETSVPSSDTTFKCTEPTDGRAAGVPRVGDWLHTKAAAGKLAPQGLRYDLVLGGGQKALTVDTIGVNVADPRAINILGAIANMSGGIFQNTADPAALGAAVFNAVNRVTPKDISFSSSSSSSLQTVQTTASQAFITRFRPNSMNTWEGHLFEAFLFDEFLNGCDPTKAVQPTVTCGQTTTKQVSADFNGDGLCNGTFLIDLDCDEITEDTATGNFVKKGLSTPANLPWDAGQVLSYQTFPGPAPAAGANPGYRSADETASNARNIFTWLNGARVDFTAANAAAIQPYLNVSAAWCSTFLSQIGVPGGTNSTLECARQIIYFVRGWDVLDQDGDGCGGPDNPRNTAACQRGLKGEERDRPSDGSATPFFWKLGDIAHSSPAVLQAPIDEIRCDTGYEKQCTWAIHSPGGVPNQTAMDPRCTGADCYQDYRNGNITRPRVLLVGANDGLLHAFDAGSAQTSQKPDLTGNYPYGNGSGAELWAFLPPDLLPRLKDLLSAHQYMVDGSVMLRDVWVDGSDATDGAHTPPAPSGADGTKQADEFHTVAIFGRRAGGNQYSALDVTNPLQPTLLWNFPQGGSDDARFIAESWADFAPRPPPIVPVKLAATPSSPGPDAGRGFSERWVVMIGGGYDPTLTQGRAVFFLDAWTGATVWRFTDDDFKATMGFSGAGAPSLFPVPGGISPLDIGDTSQPVLDVDGFFDTATWGDTGGNLWVARFQAPGVIDPATGRVSNWYAARAFEQLRRSDDAQYVGTAGAGRHEFFYMPANAFEPTTHTLHTYLGSGNREQMMGTAAACGTDNLLACCQAGCTSVTATTTENYGSCGHADTFACVGGLLTHTSTNSCPPGGASCAAAPSSTFTGSTSLQWQCPGAPATTASGSVSCDGSGLCSVAPVGPVAISGTFTAPTHNRFYGIKSYGGAATKLFSDAASAKVFDQNRFTDVPYAGACAGGSCTLVDTTQAVATYATGAPQLVTTTCADGSTTCVASANDAGWFYELGDRCPLASCNTAPPWTDEKTGSGANIVLGCVGWGGFRPVGATTSSDPCSGNQGAPTVYDYSVDYVTGTPGAACNGYASGGTAYVASQRSVTAAPGGATVRVDIGPNGKINYSTLQLDSGSPPTSASAGTRSASGAPVYWLEVPQQLHQCRHVDAAACD